jgi:SecD/SecF fusion protein
MSRPRPRLALLALLCLALAGVVSLAVPSSPFHKRLREGLDLQGGLEVVLQAAPTKGQVLTPAVMSNSINIMRQRIDKLGVSEPVVTKQGSNQIVIELPAVHNINQAAQIIGKTAVLELYDLTPSLLAPSIDSSQNPVPITSLYTLLARVQSGQKGPPNAAYLFRTTTKRIVAGPVSGPAARSELVKVLLKPFNGKVPKGTVVVTVPAKAVVIECDSTVAVVCPGVTPAPRVSYYYLFKHGEYAQDSSSPYPQLTGNDLKLSGTQQDFDPSTGQPIVTMQFTGHGDKVFHDITRAEARRGQILGTNQSFAIVLDNQLYSFPDIVYATYPDGIDPTAGGAEITGIASLSEAKSLALVLQTGALPVKFVTIERTEVSATLGKDSLKQARNAAIGGLLAVVVFLLLLYRFLGLVAVVGLAIYLAFMYGAILLLGVTLTLPGFAGLILTIGVAADANVVIFERIKEEVRAGKSVRAAIAAGYAKGFHTIVDANVVTCITALVLFAFATAEVKGFALMLLIGTVISLITAVAATRALLGLLAGFRWFADPRFMGATATEIPRWQRINVTGRRRLWFVLSLVAIVLSIGAIAVKGLNLGIDFKGGVQVTFTTPKPVSLTKVRRQIVEPGNVVQGRGKQIGADSYTSFQIRLKKLTPTEQDALTSGLVSSIHANQPSVKNVSASFSSQILHGAIWAIVGSFLLIALFVTIRYRWRFAAPILRTLINDIPITLGVYAISGREVSASTVAALLTILGYSVYDTIIVFDRIRENMRLMPTASIATIANISVREVLRRSIVTSVITLLPIAALFTLGGATLKDFAFAIMVGISVGAVSTIFIATPLLTGLMERDPEYARRKDTEMDEPTKRRLLQGAEAAAGEEQTPDTPMDVIEDTVDKRSTSWIATERATRSASGGVSAERRDITDDAESDHAIKIGQTEEP